MDLLLFGGQSSSNAAWLETLAQKLTDLNRNYIPQTHTYLAWSGEADDDDATQIKLEISNAKTRYSDNAFDVIVGKSFGSLMAYELEDKCKRIVLVGPPVAALREAGIDLEKMMRVSNRDVLVLVNANDPTTDMDFLESLAKERPERVALRVVGDRLHKYEDVAAYAHAIRDFALES